MADFKVTVGGEPKNWDLPTAGKYADIWRVLENMPLDEEGFGAQWIAVRGLDREMIRAAQSLFNAKRGSIGYHCITRVRPSEDNDGKYVLWLLKSNN